MRAGSNMRVRADHVVVIHRTTGVEDSVRANPRGTVDYCAGTDDNSRLQPRRARNGRSRVDRGDYLLPAGPDRLEQARACHIITDPNNHGIVSDPRQIADSPHHGDPIELQVQSRRIIVEEPNGHVGAPNRMRANQDSRHDLPMPAGAKDDDTSQSQTSLCADVLPPNSSVVTIPGLFTPVGATTRKTTIPIMIRATAPDLS